MSTPHPSPSPSPFPSPSSITAPSCGVPSPSISSSPDLNPIDLYCLDSNILCHFIAQYIVQRVNMTDSLINFTPSVEFHLFEIPKPSSSKNEITITLVEKFCFYLLNLCQLEYECLISAFIYLKRMEKLSNHKFRFTKLNWKISLLLCLMISSKMLDDFSMENRDFTIAFDTISLQQMNQLEILFLEILQFKLLIPLKEYQDCYHEICIFLKNGTEDQNIFLHIDSQHSPSLTPSAPRLSTKSPSQQLKPQQSSSLEQVSPQSVASSSFESSPPLSSSTSPLFDSIEFLSVTLRPSSISDFIFSLFERDDPL